MIISYMLSFSSISLFRNKKFMLDEMALWKDSKFAILLEYENPRSFFSLFFLCYFIFFPNAHNFRFFTESASWKIFNLSRIFYLVILLNSSRNSALKLFLEQKKFIPKIICNYDFYMLQKSTISLTAIIY